MLNNIKDSFFQYLRNVGRPPELLHVKPALYSELLRTKDEGIGLGQPLTREQPMTFCGREVIICEALSTEFEWLPKKD
ncbi:hypothetical protein [Acinetobacter pittii]|uniref:hypothetical protein n=1 Tax=Acinetobacter pittii TaxID=48296 RepID=UPI000F741D12|nr:hypothetical protein [Acinetobacter pittii]MDX8157822.1 hypothetical protein [Acinetobacter pittii]QRO95017.1 hypothetical protein I6J47_00780 [Acinetobacter pittii]RSO48418.1 hypothetical protein EA757_06960 [Acinetobacter pittii]RSO77808.1 hypothetical protein EA753_07870 [Acinetobacter pittii]